MAVCCYRQGNHSNGQMRQKCVSICVCVKGKRCLLGDR